MDKENKKQYINVGDMEIYKLCRELSRIGWEVYSELNWHDKKIMGDQFVEATDSAGANFTEGYNRYHFLDKNKFYYNSRASLSEANDYWMELLKERDRANENSYIKYKQIAEQISKKLQSLINSMHKLNNQK